MKRPIVVLAAALSVALPLGTAGAAEATVGTEAAATVKGRLPSSKIPLGVPGMPKYRTKSVFPGVDLFTLRHGTATDGYTVTVLIGGKESGPRDKAMEVAAAVERACRLLECLGHELVETSPVLGPEGDRILDVLAELCARVTPPGVLLEWDDAYPSDSALAAELARVSAAMARHAA